MTERARSQFSTVQILRTCVSIVKFDAKRYNGFAQHVLASTSPITICSGISFWLPCIGLVPKEVELRQAFICGRRTATSERILQDFLSWCSRSLTRHLRHPTNMQCQQKIVAGKKTTEDLEKDSISHQCPCPSVLLAILNLFQ